MKYLQSFGYLNNMHIYIRSEYCDAKVEKLSINRREIGLGLLKPANLFLSSIIIDAILIK